MAGVNSLRAITKDYVENTLDGVSGYDRRGLATALRSLFRALKRDRVIFRNPTRNRPVGDLKGIRSHPLRPSDGGARAATPLGRLVVAFAAILTLPGHEIRTLYTTGLDLSRGTSKYETACRGAPSAWRNGGRRRPPPPTAPGRPGGRR